MTHSVDEARGNMTLEIYIAYNEDGDFIARDEPDDAAEELQHEEGGRCVSVAHVTVTVPDASQYPHTSVNVEDDHIVTMDANRTADAGWRVPRAPPSRAEVECR